MVIGKNVLNEEQVQEVVNNLLGLMRYGDEIDRHSMEIFDSFEAMLKGNATLEKVLAEDNGYMKFLLRLFRAQKDALT